MRGEIQRIKHSKPLLFNFSLIRGGMDDFFIILHRYNQLLNEGYKAMNIPRSIIFASLFLIILLWSTVANEGLFALSTAVVPDNGVNHALIIGIGAYDEWPKLESPPKDAKEIARILTEKYNFKAENITLMTDDSNQKPTMINIGSAFLKYLEQLTSKDNLLVFYSGHSYEDESGETYWIPKEASKKLKVTWLKHSDICEEYLANEQFKAKNVAVITDSLFSKTLLKPTSIALSPYDLRYTEKIREQAQKSSREVISFGDKHWPGGQSTEGYGLFTYYLRKALMNNWFKVIDLENLLFEEETIFQIRQVAGTRLLRGRLKEAAMEKGGQTIITRIISPPAINVTNAYVQPKKGYAGETFTVEAVTSRDALEVYVELGGKKYLMDGEGTEWKHRIKVASAGNFPLKVFSINEEDKEGESQKIEFMAIRPLSGMVNVASASVTPRKGKGGDEFTFTAKTAASAKKVSLLISDKRYDMTGSGTDWSLKQKVEETGSVTFSVVAINDAGVEGLPKQGVISIAAGEITIVKLQSDPAKGYAGDDFLITAGTNIPARSVIVEMDGTSYAMEGSGKDWRLKRKISDIGKKQFTVIAKNMDNITGSPKTLEIVTSEKPGEKVKVRAVLANVIDESVTSAKGYAGEEFTINATTDNPADSVSLEIDGVTYDMEGSGKKWQYKKKILDAGKKPFVITAKNIDGATGSSKSGTIVAKLAVPDVATVSLPDKIYSGEDFIIKAQTNYIANQVLIEIAGKSQAMIGAGTEWSLQTKVASVGTSQYKVVAKNTEGTEGLSKQGNIVAEKKPGALINILTASVTPVKGYVGGKFTFRATTENPAEGVTLTIGGKDYEMTGSGTSWTLAQTIQKKGDIVYSVTALNEDKVEGIAKTNTFTVSELKDRYAYNDDGTITDKITGEVKQRFKDNGDGTITDISTNLMWMQSPKRIAVSYEEAEEYCSTLTQGGYSGWRLPTAPEWKDLIDQSQQAPALPQGHPFKNIIVSIFFWSKTKHSTLAQRIYVADLYRGRVDDQSKNNQYIAWPVRYAEAAAE